MYLTNKYDDDGFLSRSNYVDDVSWFLVWTGCLMRYYDFLNGSILLMIVIVIITKYEYTIYFEFCINILLLCI